VLHGALAGFDEQPIMIEARTVFELIEILSPQHPAFKADPVKGRTRIKVVGYDTEEDLHKYLDDVEVIHIVPQFNGGKAGGFLQILVGAALVAVGFFAFGATTWLGSMMMKVGALAALGGIASMLAPTPETPGQAQQSGYLGAPKNTTAIGTTIPVLFGEHKVFGHILAFDINAISYKAEEDD
jgi:predicted phage tail protein